ncbi:T9SS type A sorting domain-containing protein [Hugenholtzia roseola]|uniref:T9SS type A sorting domain-containing protein n=1 Tax=Hugenholtzia roseola TaxID=1002 RepID=UPI00041C1AC8|nr:T9SS type A sorting domain-containing protein [Hugenholtzia roseola]
MKKIFLSAILLLFSCALHAQIAVSSTAPYSNDFEAGDGGWADPDGEWELGTPDATNVEINTPAPGGVNSWKTKLSGLHTIDVTRYLTSPEFDFSAMTSRPTIAFDAWYDLEAFNSFGFSLLAYDGVHLEYSIDGGTTWDVVGDVGEGTNWYNWNTIDASGLPGWAGSNDNNGISGADAALLESSQGWFRASNLLPCEVVGESSVYFRLVLNSDVVTAFDGFGFDNIAITENPVSDIALTAITNPTSGVDLTDAETISLTLSNVGSAVITSVTANVAIQAYNGNGANANFTNTISLNLDPCGTATGTFNLPTTADLSGYDFYIIEVTATTPNDANPDNNTQTILVENRRRITAFPYTEGFEAANSGWNVDPRYQAGTIWQRGTPSKATINAAASGNNAFVTALTGNYANNSNTLVVSPVFDLSTFSGTNRAVISLANIFKTFDNADGFQIYYSTSANHFGNEQLLGAFGDQSNWYNNPASAWSGDSEGWIRSTHVLTPVYGQSNVRFLFFFQSNAADVSEGAGFDDVIIGGNVPDIAVTELITPVSSQNMLAPQIITAQLRNVGAGNIGSVVLTYKVEGSNGISEVSQTATLNLGTDQTTNFSFTAPANLSFIGDYTITVTANLAGDVNLNNNTLVSSVTHISVSEQGNCLIDENFNTAPADWQNNILAGSAAFDTWRFNNPGGRNIVAPFAGGVAAFDSDAYSSGGGAENVALESPVFNASAENEVVLSFDSYLNNSFTGGGVVEISTNGGGSWTAVASTNPPSTNVPATGYNMVSYAAGFPDAGANATRPVISESVLLPQLANQANAQIRFRWVGDFSMFWMLDNVKVCGTVPLPQITATGGNPDSVSVSWTDNSATEGGFVLQRATSLEGVGNWVVIATLPTDSTSYIDYAVQHNTTYYYRVQYQYATGLSAYSNVAEAMTTEPEDPALPYTPTLTATPGHRSANLAWNAAVAENRIRHFEVYGFDINRPTTRIGITTDNTFTVTGLLNGVKVGFRVRAIYLDGSRGEFSNGVEVMPSIVLGQDEVETIGLKVYPNPNSGSFTIRLEGVEIKPQSIRLFNTAGQVFYQETLEGSYSSLQKEIAIEGLTSGIYILEIRTEQGILKQKMTIVR